MAPMFGEMLISLSFKMTISGRFNSPALLSPSNAMPPVSAPSPITATTWWCSPLRSRAAAKPSAAEMLVLPWLVPNGSCGLSARRG